MYLNIREAIARNERRRARCRKYKALLRQVKLNMFAYQDAWKERQAERIIARCRRILKPLFDASKRAAVAMKQHEAN